VAYGPIRETTDADDDGALPVGRACELPLGSASAFLHTTEAHSFVASKYCESTPRSQVNLSHGMGVNTRDR
jgi:hypothetical protein